ncbi:MAG: hypothetical protein ACR2NP_11745 [Pirellulaceae bacterium]
MLAKKQWILLMGLAVAMAWATVAEAQLRMPFRQGSQKQAAETTQQLTQEHGPWLIMCASFTGELGTQQARQLADELNSTLRGHNLRAYLYQHRFDHSELVQGAKWAPPEDRAGLPVPMEFRAAANDSYDEIAVVVGDFATVEDASAQTVLTQIKSFRPRALNNNDVATNNQAEEQQFRAGNRGPLAAAFLMPNPLLPPEFFHARTLDNVVLKMNRGRNNLLDCPGRFSVRVATFGGERVYNASQIEQRKREHEARIQSGEPITDSELIDAIHKANVLCRALRKMGVEAYEFHDHNESYVCVGSFEWATRKLANGKDELNPEVVHVIEEFKAEQVATPQGTMFQPRTLSAFRDHGIYFDRQPMPVIVPKMNVSTRSGGIRGFLGRR